jgi:hypothetical protein
MNLCSNNCGFNCELGHDKISWKKHGLCVSCYLKLKVPSYQEAKTFVLRKSKKLGRVPGCSAHKAYRGKYPTYNNCKACETVFQTPKVEPPSVSYKIRHKETGLYNLGWGANTWNKEKGKVWTKLSSIRSFITSCSKYNSSVMNGSEEVKKWEVVEMRPVMIHPASFIQTKEYEEQLNGSVNYGLILVED